MKKFLKKRENIYELSHGVDYARRNQFRNTGINKIKFGKHFHISFKMLNKILRNKFSRVIARFENTVNVFRI